VSYCRAAAADDDGDEMRLGQDQGTTRCEDAAHYQADHWNDGHGGTNERTNEGYFLFFFVFFDDIDPLSKRLCTTSEKKSIAFLRVTVVRPFVRVFVQERDVEAIHNDEREEEIPFIAHVSLINQALQVLREMDLQGGTYGNEVMTMLLLPTFAEDCQRLAVRTRRRNISLYLSHSLSDVFAPYHCSAAARPASVELRLWLNEDNDDDDVVERWMTKNETTGTEERSSAFLESSTMIGQNRGREEADGQEERASGPDKVNLVEEEEEEDEVQGGCCSADWCLCLLVAL
jgi:hypothetical protein